MFDEITKTKNENKKKMSKKDGNVDGDDGFMMMMMMMECWNAGNQLSRLISVHGALGEVLP